MMGAESGLMNFHNNFCKANLIDYFLPCKLKKQRERFKKVIKTKSSTSLMTIHRLDWHNRHFTMSVKDKFGFKVFGTKSWINIKPKTLKKF